MPREIVTLDGSSFRFRDYIPPPLGERDVRVRVTFAAPKHGTESHVIRGSVFGKKRWDPELRMFLPAETDEPPPAPTERSIGNVVVGMVTEVGSEAATLQIGDEVFGYGSIRELHTASEERLQRLDGLSATDAVCTDPAHVALVAVRDGSVRVGDAVAVFGLGAIGLFAVQLARLSGAWPVLAVDPLPNRRAAALAMGATAALDPTAEDAALGIKLATDRHGADVAIETSGNARSLQETIRCIRQCGTVVHVPWGPNNPTGLRLDEEFHLNRPTLIASQAVWQNPDRDHPRWDEARARRTAADLFRRGALLSEGIVTPIVTFDEAPEALADIFTAPERTIKVGVRIR